MLFLYIAKFNAFCTIITVLSSIPCTHYHRIIVYTLHYIHACSYCIYTIFYCLHPALYHSILSTLCTNKLKRKRKACCRQCKGCSRSTAICEECLTLKWYIIGHTFNVIIMPIGLVHDCILILMFKLVATIVTVTVLPLVNLQLLEFTGHLQLGYAYLRL